MMLERNNNSSTVAGSIMAATTVTAVVAGTVLTLFQTDYFSRFWLSSDKLAKKRSHSYIMMWNKVLEQYRRIFWMKTDEGQLILLSTKSEIQDFVENQLLPQLVRKKKKKKNKDGEDEPSSDKGHDDYWRIARIGQDREHFPTSNEYFVWLYRINVNNKAVYQLKFDVFIDCLELAMDKLIFSHTFCFIYDGAGSLAERYIVDLLLTATNKNTAVQVLPRPTWLIQFAALLLTSQTEVLFSSGSSNKKDDNNVNRILYTLCRLEAMSSETANKKTSQNQQQQQHTTVVLTIPMSVVPILLPKLHTAFPNDRHVFGYTGCIQTLRYATTTTTTTNEEEQPPQLVEDLVSWKETTTTTVVADTTPMNDSVHTVSHTMKREFHDCMSKLDYETARITECWMSAANAYLVRKQMTKATEFLPYVCKLDYLFASSSPLEMGSGDRYWSLRSLLQFLTGSARRELPQEQMERAISWCRSHETDAARRWMPAFCRSDPSTFDPKTQKAVEATVFAHKLILLADKTLIDTVQPQQHWTLKQAMKKGCACCMEEEDEEDDEEEEGIEEGDQRSNNNTNPLMMATTSNARPPRAGGGYVDGKMGFAFDPSKFS